MVLNFATVNRFDLELKIVTPNSFYIWLASIRVTILTDSIFGCYVCLYHCPCLRINMLISEKCQFNITLIVFQMLINAMSNWTDPLRTRTGNVAGFDSTKRPIFRGLKCLSFFWNTFCDIRSTSRSSWRRIEPRLKNF